MTCGAPHKHVIVKETRKKIIGTKYFDKKIDLVDLFFTGMTLYVHFKKFELTKYMFCVTTFFSYVITIFLEFIWLIK